MSLDGRDRRLLRLSAAIVLGDWEALRAVRRAAPAGEPDRAWREALLQAHLFAGFPRVVEACEVLAAEGGLGDPEPAELSAPAASAAGRALFDAIYGELAEPVRGRLAAHHPVLARWIEDHAYGTVLAREGLAPARRELLAVVCLAATRQERQLASHARGALRLGASAQELAQALEVVGDLLGAEAAEVARRIVARFVRGEG